MERVVRSLLALTLLLAALEAGAQYPAKPVRIVVPLSPGGFADVPARLLMPHLSAAFGKQFYVENKAGAGGTIGANEVAKAAPDGETLLFIATPHVISAHLYKSLPYDSIKDFAPVALVGAGPYALVVNPGKLPVSSVRELIASAKANPGKIDYASSGNGSAQHLVGALFNAMAGVQLNHIPYKGSGPALQDLLGGQVPVSFAGIPNVLSSVKAGKLRALAVTGAKRWSELPEVPTIAEAGVRDFEATLWVGLAAPAKTPASIIVRLNAEVGKALHDPELRKSFVAAGVEAATMSPRDLGVFIRAEHEKWGKVVKATGATVN
jgi:tripartite-type tricarboxylate transporter receptor subunit TctC